MSTPPKSPRRPAAADAPARALDVVDHDAFRRKLAGLVDPDRPLGGAVPGEIREVAIRFASILASLFGPSLDRKTLWDRIGSALASAVAKTSDDDLEKFASLCLDHVKAEDSYAAASAPLGQVMETFVVRPPEWRAAFLSYVRSHRYSILVHARDRWERFWKKEIDL